MQPTAKWEYYVGEMNISERWGTRRQQEQFDAFRVWLNQAGANGWELISYESIPLTGHFTDKIKGYVYLAFFKRQVGTGAGAPPPPPAT